METHQHTPAEYILDRHAEDLGNARDISEQRLRRLSPSDYPLYSRCACGTLIQRDNRLDDWKVRP